MIKHWTNVYFLIFSCMVLCSAANSKLLLTMLNASSRRLCARNPFKSLSSQIICCRVVSSQCKSYNAAEPELAKFPDEIQPYLKYLYQKRVLVVGDGDFSFSRALAEWRVCATLHTSTLETKQNMSTYYPNSTIAAQEIERYGGNVFYEIDAFHLKKTLSASNPNDKDSTYDVVAWNFPHVAGKQNIRYNRELLQLFFQSAPEILKPDGSILISLVEGQSGYSTENTRHLKESDETWGASWKLIEQASESGLLITDTGQFSWQLLPYYQPQGRRGNRGGFLTGNADFFRLQVPAFDRSALQAPLYASELHLWLRKDDFESMNLLSLENRAREGALRIVKEELSRQFPSISVEEPVVLSVDVVDVYRCVSNTIFADDEGGSRREVVIALQLTYLSRKLAWSRKLADSCRVAIEARLPTELNMQPRSERLGHSVSLPYPWFVTMQLQGLYNESRLHSVTSSAVPNDNSQDAFQKRIEQRQEQLRAASEHLRATYYTAGSSSNKNHDDSDGSSSSSSSSVEVLPGRLTDPIKYGLWQRRIGILFRGRTFTTN